MADFALLVTTSQSLLLVDACSGELSTVHRGSGLYYGIAKHEDRWHVAARGRTPSSDKPGEEERGQILVFDERMRQVDALTPPFALRDMHEILAHDGTLWVTCSYDNMVATYDFAERAWARWYPLGETPNFPYDVNHLNSIAVTDDVVLLVAHNWGDSELLRFDRATRELLARTPFGVQSHNIRELDGRLITSSSGESALIDQNGWRLFVGGFPRGLLFTQSHRYVGISTTAERHERDFSDGRIDVFDADWQRVRSFDLPREGLVLDIQPFVRASAPD